MTRVLAVVLIATLTTMMTGIDATSRVSQDREKIDVVIQEITPDAVIVLRQQRDHVVTETIPIIDIATIKKASLKRMSTTSKVLIGVAVGFGVLVGATLAACASASSARAHPGTADLNLLRPSGSLTPGKGNELR